MAIYEQLCGCVLTIEKGETHLTHACDKHGSLSFGGAWASGAASEPTVRDRVRLITDPAYSLPDAKREQPKRSVLGMLGDAIFGDIEIRSVRPGAIIPMDTHSHTLCDEQVDYINLSLTRERIELLQERRQWIIARKKDPVAGANRITEIDAEISMIDGITLKLRRQA